MAYKLIFHNEQKKCLLYEMNVFMSYKWMKPNKKKTTIIDSFDENLLTETGIEQCVNKNSNWFLGLSNQACDFYLL